MRYGTKEELEAAKDDATLLPFDALFMSKFGCPKGKEVFREASELDESFSVYMVSKDEYTDFHSAAQLEAINV